MTDPHIIPTVAIPLAMEWGYLLASTLNAVLAQRLVRTLCPECRAPHPYADALIERAHAVGGTLIVVEEAFGVRFEIQADVILVQVINHSTEHRSQICTVLTSFGVEPPAIDLWAYGEAVQRTRPEYF